MSSAPYTLTIAAGKTEPINAAGNFFHVIFSAVDVEIAPRGGSVGTREFSTYGQGTGLDLRGKTFGRLEVRNPSLGAITVKIFVGDDEGFRDARAALIEPDVECAANGTNPIAATTAVSLDGIPTGLRIRRKALLVTNLDQNLDLQVRTSAGAVIATVFPRQTYTLPISRGVQVYNPNGSAVACNIAELWWSL